MESSTADQTMPAPVPAPVSVSVFRPPIPPLAGGTLAFGLKPTSKLNALSAASSAEDITKGNFIAKNFTSPLASSWKKSPVDRIRDIDFVTMYKPSAEECDNLNLTGDKLSLKSQYSLMLLSGGCKGCRFSSQDINTFLQLSKDVHVAHNEVIKIFDSMSSNSKKSKIKSFPVSLGEEDPLLVEYHQTCDSYMCVLLRLQTLVREKQQSLSAGERLERGDMDSKVGLPVPRFLSVLMDTYNDATVTSPNVNVKKKPTIGKLSAFLSCCVVGLIAIEGSEMIDALDELMEASNDTEYNYAYAPQEVQVQSTGRFSYSCHLRSATNESEVTKSSSLSKEYIAKRIFSFLSKLTEVKSYVMDEKSLLCFDFLDKSS